MAKKYAFNDKGTAERLARMAGGSQPSSVPTKVALIKGQGWILRTPASGIAARVGVTCDVVDCVVYKISHTSGDLQPFQVEGQDVEHPVYNIFSADVAGDTFITAKVVDGKLCVDAEDCG